MHMDGVRGVRNKWIIVQKDKIKRKIAIIEENKILLAVFLVVSIIIGSLLNGYLLESAKMIFDINYKRKTFFQLIAMD